jgi:5'-nucleotidase
MIDFLNYLGVNYATFGNHEFDYGYDSLKARLKGIDTDVTDDDIGFFDYPESKTTWIMTNMTEKDGVTPAGGPDVKKTVLVDWPASEKLATGKVKSATVKVGLLAVSENWIENCSQLKTGELLYEDFIASAKKAAKELRAQGAEIVLALSHSRLENDYKIASAVPEVDLFLGGHDHFYKSDIPKRIIKSGEEWRWTSHVIIDFEPNSKKPIITLEKEDIASAHEHDLNVDKLVDKYKALKDKKFLRSIFNVAFDMDPRDETVRFGESLLANWIADICTEDYSLKDGLQSCDIALLTAVNFSGKAVIPAGEFTIGTLMSIFPKIIHISVVKLSGDDIIKILTHGAKVLPNSCGSLFHVSSRLSYTVVVAPSPNAKKIAPVVIDVLFDGQPIDTKRIYTVATDNKLDGAFGLSWFKAAERVVDTEYAATIQDIVKMYCARHRNTSILPCFCGGDGLEPAVSSFGRLKVVTKHE